MSRRVRVGAAVAALLAILVVASGVAGGLIYNQLSAVRQHCGGSRAGQTPATFTADPVDTAPYEMPVYQDVSFPSRDRQASIAAWYVPAAGTSAPRAVIVVHGLNGCRRAPEVLLAAGMLHRAGIAALLIDLRNQGDSSVTNGHYAGGTLEYQDLLGAWDWLRGAHGFAAAAIGAMGFSLGAGTVMDATGEEPRLAAAWEDSGFSDVGKAIGDELARNGYPPLLAIGGLPVANALAGHDLTMPNPIWAAGRLGSRPVAIVHGEADARMPVRHATDLAGAIASAGGRVEVWLVPGAGHTQTIFLRPAEYESRLDGFFTAALTGPVSSGGPNSLQGDKEAGRRGSSRLAGYAVRSSAPRAQSSANSTGW